MSDKTRLIVDSLIGGKIGAAYLRARRLFRAHMTELNLSPVEFYVLALAASGDLHQSALSLALNISTQNLTIVLDDLEKRTLITRVQSKTDGRVRLIHLTTHGSQSIKHALREIVVVEDELTGALSPGERLIFGELLDKVSRSGKSASRKKRASPYPEGESTPEYSRKKNLKVI